MYAGYKKELGLSGNVKLSLENEPALRTYVLHSLFPQLNYSSTATAVAKKCNLSKNTILRLGYGYYGRSISNAPNRHELIRIIQSLRNHKTPTITDIPLPEIQHITEDNVDAVYAAHFENLENKYADEFSKHRFAGNTFLDKMRRKFLGLENLDERVVTFIDYLYYHQPIFKDLLDSHGEEAVLDEFLTQRIDSYIKNYHSPIYDYQYTFTENDYYNFLDNFLHISWLYVDEDAVSYNFTSSTYLDATESLLVSSRLNKQEKHDLRTEYSTPSGRRLYPKSKYSVTPLVRTLSKLKIDYAPILSKHNKDYTWLYRTLDLENGYEDFLLLLEAVFKDLGWSNAITIHRHSSSSQFFSLEFSNLANSSILKDYSTEDKLFTTHYPLYTAKNFKSIYAYFTTDTISKEEYKNLENLSYEDSYIPYIKESINPN